MNKINLYVFSQIVKSCILVFFIFVSIAWLMQLSRLFSIMYNLQVKFIDIFSLSLWLIPNLTNVTLPFIIIFGLVLGFLKLSKDREIIAIYSLGLSINEIKKPIICLILLCIIIYSLLNSLISPFTYNIYKQKEFSIRNNIEFDKINISNFIELEGNLIIDFEKENNYFSDILINYEDNNENIIYAKKGNIKNENNKIIFSLVDGFKLMINSNKIEKLIFDKYKIEFPTNKKEQYIKYDKNTLNIFELIKNNTPENLKILINRQFDILLIISLSLFFYYSIIIKNIYTFRNIIFFLLLSILTLIIDNFLENYSIENKYLLYFNILNLFIVHLFSITFKILKIDV